jgi:hypothetical protein
MANRPDTGSEEWRRICEARDWLRHGYTTPEKVGELDTRIAGKRGDTAADELLEEVRRQWKIRRE